MAKTTYHKDKIYVPAEIRERIGLKDGEKATIEIKGPSEILIRFERPERAEERIIRRIMEKPFELDVKRPLSREIYYERD